MVVGAFVVFVVVADVVVKEVVVGGCGVVTATK